MICRATSGDAKALTELTIRSKSHWGYGKQQIERWREELTVTEVYIAENEVYKCVDGNSLIGFYAFAPETEKKVKLNYLFIAPEFIGLGYGKILMHDFYERATAFGFQEVVLDADPHAEEFYSRLGFQKIGKLQSSIKNRFLPIMARFIPAPRTQSLK